jgi:hypothetical protein
MSREDVHDVIDVVQGRAPSINENARFQEVWSRQEEDFLLWGYADLAPAWDELEEYMAENEDDAEFDADKMVADMRANADRVTLTVSARNDGFIIDATLLRAPGAAPDQAYVFDTAFDSHYADRAPEDTLAFFAGYDLYNEVYAPARDSLMELDVNFADPYCGELSALPIYPGEYSEQDDPVYGQFYDEAGNFDYEAYDAWQAQLDQLFTNPDGSFNYEGYTQYFDGVYEEYCSEKAQTLEEAIAEFEQDVGFDLEDDLLSLMTGEFAVALNASDFEADEPDIDVIGMLDVTDAARVEESLGLLADYIEREEGWQIDPADEAGIHRMVEGPGSNNVVAWTVTDDGLAVGYPDSPVELFAAGPGGPSLAESDDWQEMMALLPEQKTFVGYVSLSRLIKEIRRTEGTEQDFAEFTDGDVTFDDLEPIRSVGFATANVEGGLQFRIAVLVKD